jgi:pimeloyl-ACP methyl ester carboxylesterase
VFAITFLFVAALAAGGEPAEPPSAGCVVLLHGMARTSASMERMRESLADSGYLVANIAYPSRDYPLEKLAPMAVGGGIGLCRELGYQGRVHFVTHSLGGILVRYYFATNPADEVGRVVMLAPPNQGSNAADAMRGVPGFDWLNGPAGRQLGKGDESVPLRLGTPQFEFAVVAGNPSIDPITSSVLENPDDGKVSVDDTRLEGMKDFRVMPVSHAYIMQDDDVIELVRAFLASGRFPELRSGPE